MALSCPACARALRPEARFCDACGAAAAGADERPQSSSERRQVTVMFSDLVGSTLLAERMDPEELLDLVHGYHGLCAEAIRGFGGHLAQYLGDGVLAYFGYPIAHEHDAGGAVRAGLSIVRQMRAGREGQELRLAVRVGIHSGLVVAGEMVAGQQQRHLPVGSTVNIAARLQGVAEPNTVVISDATERLTHGFFSCRDLGTPALKNVSKPIRVYEVVSESGAQSFIEAAMRSGLTPLVARNVERSALFERWERARGGAGQLVYVSGEGGIGKSRLLLELKQRLADELHTRLECRCSPHHENSALYPAIDLLRRTWRLEGVEQAAERSARLERALAPYAAEVPEAMPLMAALLSVPLPDGCDPLDLTPQRQKQRTLETLVEILVRMARDQPLLLIVEDLHWIDPSSIELLSLLIARAPAERMLVLLLFRPGFEPPWTEVESTRITLNRLTTEEAGDMIRMVAGGRELPPEVVRGLCSRADGVPLYLEELTKTMLESGQLEECEGRYELVGPQSALEIPATLQESLMARLDRLVPVKEVLQIGATIGRAFSYELLRAVTRLGEEVIQQELERLVAGDVLRASGSPPQAKYVFKHALIQEAAYEALTRNKRRDYHHRIAEILKTRFPQVVETQPELLGHHWAGAGQPGEAADYYHRAGRRALERSADAEAASHLTRGLELLGSLAASPEHTRLELELLIDLGVALRATKGFTAPETEEVFARARALCDEVGEPKHLYAALSGVFLFHQARSELKQAFELTQQRLQVAQRLRDEGLVMQVHENLGTLAFWRGDFAASLESLEQALVRYDADRARELALVYGTDSSVVCDTYAAQVLWFLGFSDQALERCQRSVARARALNHANSLGLALGFAAALHQLRREPPETQRFAEEAVAFSTEQGLEFWRGMGMIFHGCSLVEQGQAQAGIARMLEGIASYQDTGAGLGGPLCLAMLAEAHLEAGKADEGLGMLSGGLQLLGSYEDRFFDAEVQRVKARLMLATVSPDAAAAEEGFLSALSCARAQGARQLELRAAIDLARLWGQRGEQDRACALLDPLFRGFSEGFETPDLRDAAGLLAELSLPAPPRSAPASR